MRLGDDGMMSIARLRERAERCRQLAAQALADGIACELEELARDYDDDAARLEVSDPDGSSYSS